MSLRPLLVLAVAAACGGKAGGGGVPEASAKEAEGLYEEGRSWVEKARTAPAPAPAPVLPPGGRGVMTRPPPEFKPEERMAVQLFEKALTLRPDHARAQLALADLLASHTLRRQVRDRAAAAQRRPGRKAASPPPVAPFVEEGLDFGVDRVLRAYEAAMGAEPAGRQPVERLIAFAVAAGRLEAAEAGHQELVRRIKESAEPFVLYGDFLLNVKKDEVGALEQYRQALIWKANDEATRRKLAEIYLSRGAAYYGRQQYALAQDEFRQAERYVTDRSSELGARLQRYQTRMREIRR